MGVRTLLTSVRRDVNSVAYELWEEADGSVVQYIGGVPVGGATSLHEAYLGPVAGRTLIPNTKHATNKQGMFRSIFYAFDNIDVITVNLANWWYASQTESLPGASADFTLTIEYPLGSTPQRFTFNGNTTGTAADGATLATDALTLTQQIPFLEPFALDLWANMPNGLIYNTTSAYITGDRGAFGVTTPDLTATGGAGIGAAGTGAFPPIVAILGQTQKATVALPGDSIQLGAINLVNTTFAGSGHGDQGVTARSLGAAGIGYLNLGSYGDRAQTFITSAGTRRKALMAYCSHICSNYGTNDIGTGRTAVQALADIATIARWYPSKPFYQHTLPPRTTSTDSWATTANQTVTAQEAERVAFNNGIFAGPSWMTGLFDSGSVVESSRGSGLWIPGQTIDGTHLKVTAQNIVQGSGVVNPAMIL